MNHLMQKVTPKKSNIQIKINEKEVNYCIFSNISEKKNNKTKGLHIASDILFVRRLMSLKEKVWCHKKFLQFPCKEQYGNNYALILC